MELQQEPALRLKTPRVKAIVGDPSKQEVAVCLFSGDVQFYDKSSLAMTRSLHVSDDPVRSGVYAPSQDWLILGLDDGNMVVLEYGTLSVIEKIPAHDDFVRKIALDDYNKRLVTVSDDNTAKLWSFSSGSIVLTRVYKDAKHFVMDVAFCPNDRTFFVSVSLDGKARLYSVEHQRCIETFRGHKDGVNCVEFLGGGDMFVTGSDDTSIIVWDYKRRTRITSLPGHTNNVVALNRFKNGIASCSEDGTVRLWNNNFKVTAARSFSGRIWSIYVSDGKVFVGGDEELVVLKEEVKRTMHAYSAGKIFYNQGDMLKMMRTEEMGVSKEVGPLESSCTAIHVNSTGKMIATTGSGTIDIFSSLGLRKKLSLEGEDIVFVDDAVFCVKNGCNLDFYVSSTKDTSLAVPGLTELFYADSEFLIVACGREEVQVLSRKGDALYKTSILVEKATRFSDYFVFFSDKIHFYDSLFNKIDEVDVTVETFCSYNGILYVSTLFKTFYLLVTPEGVRSYPIKYLGHLIGISEDRLYHMYPHGTAGSEPVAFPLEYLLDSEFTHFQLSVLRGEEPKVTQAIQDRAIAFYEELGKHDEALKLSTNEAQRFHIFLKMQDFESAMELADSPAKYQRIGEAFMRNGILDRAAECFKAAGDWSNLLLADVFSKKVYLEEVARIAARRGEHNLSFMAYYKAKNFRACEILLQATPYAELFKRTYGN